MRTSLLITILLLISTVKNTQAQTNWYQTQFEKADSLLEEGLPRETLPVIDLVYQRALVENNNVQLVKSIVLRNKIISALEEDPLVNIIDRLNSDLLLLTSPSKQIIHSMLAEIHQQYYWNNRWRFHQRTVTKQTISDDIRTWDLQKLHAAMLGHLKQSLSDEPLLQSIPVADFSVLTEGDSSLRYLRPTLYDLLANRALTIIQNPETGLTKPTEAFHLNDERFFTTAKTFVNIELSSTDTLSLNFQSLVLYQKLTRLRLEQAKPEALTDLELNRINYLYNNSKRSNKQALAEAFFNELAQQNIPDEPKAEVLYRHALLLSEIGSDNSKNLVESIKLCNKVISDYPRTKAFDFCTKLKADIENPFLSTEAEAYELPNSPFRLFARWKNLQKIHFHIYQMNSHQAANLMQTWNFEPDSLAKYQKLKSWEQVLPAFTDYSEHTAEIPVDELKKGFYLLVATETANTDEAKIFTSNLVQITSLSVLNRNMPKGQLFAVTNAKSGTPIQKALLSLQIREYNKKSRQWEFKPYKQKLSNQQGEVVIKKNNKNTNLKVMVSHNNDTILLGDKYFGSFDSNLIKKQLNINFFTDRAIYRPGQTVHFKGIVLEQKNDKTNIVPQHKETILLLDANRQQIAKVDLVSNEYGTFSGSFNLPVSGLNGKYSIKCNLARQSFRVEEYRRPNFELSIDQPKRSFTFGDTIEITGLAQTFSGIPVDKASVSYTVTRREEVFWWRRPALPDSQIETGNTTTNNDGQFKITFTDPANDIDDKSRVMVYEISAEATDISGETRTATLKIRISKTNLLVDCNLPTTLNSSNFESAKVKTSNMNGEPVPAEASIQIVRLKTPDNLMVNRYWATPDTFLISEKAFKKRFPNYPYRDENDVNNWEKGKTVYQKTIQTTGEFNLDFDEWIKNEAGHYKIIIEARTPGQTAKWEQNIRLISEKPSKADVTNNWLSTIKAKGEPGEVAEFWLTALNPQSPIRFELVRGDELIKSELIYPGKKVYQLQIPIDESYRGNVTAQFVHVANNRRYHQDINIEVPYTNKQLSLSFLTFRNELLPGETERWSLLLTDHSGKGVAAEMLASLYDASLDQFVKHQWPNSFLPISPYNAYSWDSYLLPRIGRNLVYNQYNFQHNLWTKEYEQLPLLSFSPGGYNGLFFARQSANTGQGRPIMIRGTKSISEDSEIYSISETLKGKVAGLNVAMELADEAIPITRMEESLPPPPPSAPDVDFSQVQLRSNFNETAFFYPHLYSEEDGKIELSFTIPEAITRWRMMGFAHTKDLKHGSIEKELVTRKQVSISAYAPRFLRENDTLRISAKISNLTSGNIQGNALLQFSNAIDFKTLTPQLIQGDSILAFDIEANSSGIVTWEIIVPTGLQAVSYKVMAKTEQHTDGEQKTLPVLTNRQLVTESLPFMVRGGTTQKLFFEKMATHGSSTLKNHAYTIEYTSNPAWYAIQALPYLMDYPYECAEQVFSRLYANASASAIVNSSPRTKAVFEAWKTVDTGAFLSNLEKNSELKSVILEESPWLLNAKSESEAKQRIGLLFDLNRMGNELSSALKKLEKIQLDNGGFPWFSGMPDNRYITQYIAKGMGEMEQMNIVNQSWTDDWNTMRHKAMDYLDQRIVEDFRSLEKQAKTDTLAMQNYQPGMLQLHYLYTRSFYPNEKPGNESAKVFDFMLAQAKKHWLAYSEHAQAMMALTLVRFGDKAMADRIIKSLANRAIRSKEDGMYWRNNRQGYFWYQSPIETQALLIQAFDEITGNETVVEEMKIWLLRNKQTTHWKTTKATTAATYALLRKGYNLLDNAEGISVRIAGQPLEKIRIISPEAGTGYVKTAFEGPEIEPGMAKIEVTNPNKGVAWGAAYWQYFEQLDKITQAQTDVAIDKKMFVREQTNSGTILRPISENAPIKVGNEVVVRMEIRTSRDMEYVHLKDLRAAGFEPAEAISGYRWQDGLGYYQEIKDAAMNFFIAYLPKGTYVFEYRLRASHAGMFSNGITSLQCMYAPEFTTHSEGIRISIEP